MSEKKRIEFVSSMAHVQKQHVHPSVRKVFGATAAALAGLLERIERLEQEVHEPKALAGLLERIESLEKAGEEPEEKAAEESQEEPENATDSSPA